MATRTFGEISGNPPMTWYPSRTSLSAAGVHRPTQAGISGTASDGSDSIVVSGGYEDDEDFGSEIIYTGAGGKNPNSDKQIANQTLLQPGNAGLVTSQLSGYPVRVVRGFKGDPAHSPASGYRYDGLFRVVDHWSETGRSGFRIWRYQLRQLDPDEALAFTGTSTLPAGNVAPGTTTGVVTRTVRSTATSNAIKRLYRGECQVCSIRLRVPGGLVSEGAHIRGLGRPHYGPDVPANILCLCPNHHSLLDNGGIYIEDNLQVRDLDGNLIGPLAVHAGHSVDLSHVRYHRGVWGY